MKRKIDEANDLKEEGKSLEEEEGCADMKDALSLEDKGSANLKQAQSSEEDDDSDFDSDSSSSSDGEPVISYPEAMLKRDDIEDLASRLKDDPKVIDDSVKILNYLKEEGEDVESFSEMVNRLLNNESLSKEWLETCKKHRFHWGFITFFGNLNQTLAKTTDLLSRINEDWRFKRGKDQFFKVTVNEGNSQMVVRGALSILVSYCISTDYLKKVGVWSFSNYVGLQ